MAPWLRRLSSVDPLNSGVDRDLGAGDRYDLLHARDEAAARQGAAADHRQDSALERVQSEADRADARSDRKHN